MYVIIIQARMGSTRLPGKILKKLLNKEILLWCYDRCNKSLADAVYVATSTNSENDVLEELCIEKKILCYKGSEFDLLDRYYTLAKYLNEKNLNIIRVTSDCPFIDTTMINDMIKFFENNNYDYIINHSKSGITPEGSGIEIINFKSLEYLWLNESDASFREHATGILSKINKYDNVIKTGEYIYQPFIIDDSQNHIKNLKISVDTKEDYEISEQIVNHFKTYDFSYKDILLYFLKK